MVHTVRRFEIAAPLQAVWAAMTGVDRFRHWWPWLRAFEGTVLAEGERWACQLAPPAPYRLRVVLHLVEVVPARRVAAEVSGDVSGTARLDLRPIRATPEGPAGAGHGPEACELVLESSLEAVKPVVRLACALLPGLAGRSHGAVVDAAVRQFAAQGVGAPLTVGPHPGVAT
jgi:uncharacterized protein YndB with AHSA1/START domain